MEVRGSICVVTDAQQQSLPRPSPDETVAELQHSFTLQSLGEDNLGDELRVDLGVSRFDFYLTITSDEKTFKGVTPGSSTA